METRIVNAKSTTEDLRKENEKLRRQLERHRYLALDMLEKLEALVSDCKEIMEGQVDD